MSAASSRSDVLCQFRMAMRNIGLNTDELLVADGRLHRFCIDGDRRDKRNGWYVLHLDGLPAGEFGCWKRGVRQTWHSNTTRRLTATERKYRDILTEYAKSTREIEQANTHATARARATKLWDVANNASAFHPYLVRKAVAPHGLRQSRGLLIIPVRDWAGTLHGLQYISADGEKNFLRGTVKRGAFHLIGNAEPHKPMAITEGYATAATIHQATGWAVAVAFDAGNLESVALAITKARPHRAIVIAADNDRHCAGNPGLTKGRSACAAVGGLLIFPNFRDGDPGTDWNDYAGLYGVQAIRMSLLALMDLHHAD